MIPRPDERAAEEYEERDRRFRGKLKGGIGTAASLGLGAAAGLGSKILPFINEYIPTDLALKGISKVAPSVGAFLRKGQQMGLDVEEGLQFVKEKMISKEQPKDNRNVIQQYSPELHQFLDQEIKKGRTPIQAGALAQMDKKFLGVIKKMSEDHKTPWSSIIESVFGGQQPSGGQSQQTIQQQPGNQPPQGGQGQAALLAILQKIQQARGTQ